LWAYSSYLVESGLISNQSGISGARQLYLPFATEISNFWQPLRTATFLELAVKRYIVPLVALVVSPAIVASGSSTLEKWRGANSRRKRAGSVTRDTDRALLKVISDSGARGATLDQILNALKETAHGELTRADVLAGLRYAEGLGIVARGITDSGGEPVLAWKGTGLAASHEDGAVQRS